MLLTKENIDIKKFRLVNEFLKKKSKNYISKKSLVLEVEQIKKFLREAPNSTFLLIKVRVRGILFIFRLQSVYFRLLLLWASLEGVVAMNFIR